MKAVHMASHLTEKLDVCLCIQTVRAASTLQHVLVSSVKTSLSSTSTADRLCCAHGSVNALGHMQISVQLS